MDKRKLYERIMRNVSKEVKAVLSESMNFEHNELGDILVEFIMKNERIKNVVADSTKEEWMELFGILAAMKNEPAARCSAVISNMKNLACNIKNGLNNKLASLYSMSDDEKDELAEYMCGAFANESNNPLNGCGGVNKNAQGKKSINACNDNDDDDDSNDNDPKKKTLNDNCGRNRKSGNKKHISENRGLRHWLDRR